MAQGADPNKVAMLRTAMSRASKLMQLESNGSLDKIAKAHENDINLSLNNNSDVTTESMVSTKRKRNMSSPSVGGAMVGAGANNVPSVIRESFMKNPIDDSALYTQSLGDGRDIDFLTEGMSSVQPRQQVSAEQIRQYVNESAQPQGTSQQIDYPMIRTIVEEIVRKYTVSLKKNLMTESKQGGSEINTIMLGKGFKFLDSKGNLYECTMKKIGNINDKKKSIKD